jgi:carboxyl-terminal processing protease
MKTVRCVVVLFVLAISFNLSQAQTKREIKSVLDSVIVNAKKTALNTRKVDWDSIETVMREKAKYAKTIADLRGSFEAMFVALKDRQGLILDPVTSTAIAGFPVYQDPELPPSQAVSEISKAKFEFKVLKDGTCYLKIVSIPYGADVEKEASIIRKALESMAKNETQNWIIDLRFHAGGDALPVMAGLAPLFGQGMIATANDGRSKIRNLYSVHNGKLFDNQQVVVNLPVFTKDVRNDKVAVLTSKYTAGAGEIVAIAFKGRKNMKSFGERTAGKINGTNYIEVTEHVVMSISDTQFFDRKGNVYKENVKPDSFISAAGDQNKVTSEASYWLNSEPVSLAAN